MLDYWKVLESTGNSLRWNPNHRRSSLQCPSENSCNTRPTGGDTHTSARAAPGRFDEMSENGESCCTVTAAPRAAAAGP